MHPRRGSIGEVSLVRWHILSPFSRSPPSRSAVAAVPPISALPPELLVQIFRSLALMVPPLCGWIAITHIHARVLALESSCARRPATRFCGPTNLGSALSAKWWLSEMLVRARNAPLDVYFAAPPRNTIRAHPARLPHSQAPAPAACLCLSFKVSWRFARWKLLSWSI